MGAWGPGLYSSDIARDLKPLVASVVRLPVVDAELLSLIAARYPGTADDPKDEDYPAFWLVLADQFAKLGIDCPKARERALAVIDTGADLATMESLGMGASDLRKRQAMLTALRPAIADAPPARKRATLKQPQPWLMEVGDCFAYPTSKGRGINAYFPDKARDHTWRHDGWGAAIVCERGRAFGYLAWYRLCALDPGYVEKPVLAQVRAGRLGAGLTVGTCSPVHFRRLELEHLGSLPVDPAAIHRLVPELRATRDADTAAILDVSVCNNLAAEHGLFAGPPVVALLRA